MKRIDLDKFLAENPPSYGVSTRNELERRAKRRVALLISLTIASAIAVSLYKAFGSVDIIPFAIMLLVIFPIFFGLAMFKLFLMFYEIEKSIPRMQLEQFARFVNEFKPESWACGGNRFVRFLVMRKNRSIYALFFASGGRLIKGYQAEEREITMKDKAKIMLGKVEGKKQLLKDFKLEGYRFKIYKVESAILPHPDKENALSTCKNCIEISWSSWAFLPLYIEPNLLVRVLNEATI